MGDQENLNPEEEMTNHPLADDAVPLCPGCLEPCDPLSHYCPNCGSNEVINPLASYMPFVDLRFRLGMIGKLWRKTWASNTAFIDRILYIFLFMVFFPFLLLIGLPFVIYEKVMIQKENRDIQESQ